VTRTLDASGEVKRRSRKERKQSKIKMDSGLRRNDEQEPAAMNRAPMSSVRENDEQR
jgi:hypothetical protein